MLITNTCLNHKLAHRTTWISPQRKENIHHHRNQIEYIEYNQIEYIIVKKSHRNLINDSHSYGGFQKLVKMQIRFEWWNLPQKKPLPDSVNRESSNDEQICKEYQESVSQKVQAIDISCESIL